MEIIDEGALDKALTVPENTLYTEKNLEDNL